MASFLSRALRFLGGSYSIAGSEVSTNQVDLSSVQLVHDVASELRAGRAPGLWAGWGVAMIHFEFTDESGATTPSDIVQLNPYTSINPQTRGAWPPGGSDVPPEFDLYCYGVSLGWEDVDDRGGSISNAQASIRYSQGYRFDNTAGNVRGQAFLLQTFSGNAYNLDDTNEFGQRPNMETTTPFPVLIPRATSSISDAVLEGRVAASLPGTGGASETGLRASMQFLCRWVPRGLIATP